MNIDAPTASQFDDAEQQRHAAASGMWLFLATEVLFFGGLFLGCTVCRLAHPAAFREASRHTLAMAGTVNTAVLLLSSFSMVRALNAHEAGRRPATARWLAATACLGALFLAVKRFEYGKEIQEGLWPGPAFHLENGTAEGRLFFYLYFLMTGIHAVHVFIGVFLLSLFTVRVKMNPQPAMLSNSLELLGLYWHFVDLVWVFLFPLLYLSSRAS